MADPQTGLWSDSPNAPQISRALYLVEKANFAGISLGVISYGIIIVLFFQCMSALLNPVDGTRGGIKWPLVAYTVVVFSIATLSNAIGLDVRSISYVDNREFPGIDGELPPGPAGYENLITLEAIILPSVTFFLNNWLADGFLLYRCYVVFAMNHWVMALPCLMYLTSFAMGIIILYHQGISNDNLNWYSIQVPFSVSCFSISMALNALLTFMIVIRVILHSRNMRKAMGSTSMASGLYETIVTMLVESSAIYTIGFLLYIVTWGTNSFLVNAFAPFCTDSQVITPLLIILRVANRRALTRDAIVSGNVSALRFGSEGKSTDGDCTLSDGNHAVSSMGVIEVTPDELSAGGDLNTIDEPL